MVSFRIWLEEQSKENVQDAIISILGLDKETGPSTSLDSFEPADLLAKIEGLGLWNMLPPEKQHGIKSMIIQQRGIVADVVDKIAEFGQGNQFDRDKHTPTL